MNKADLIQEVQKQLGAECSKAHAEKAVNALIASIQRGLKKDKAVQIVGFGTFAVKNRKARMGRNPATGEPIKIPPKTVVKARIVKQLKDAVLPRK